ncbi:MAG TPA: PilZ domain-containing protein [Patescibacteria group bacterium]|jgi:uncharacterized protein (TIGR02266 family)|nr:PilZ domain-containing protein [Patescibacteria group bacterium]
MSDQPFRRIQVTAPYGILVHEIRLSMNEGRWQARVVTLPNHIWVEPGGLRALVFESDSAQQATDLAAAFIQRDCVARGHRVTDPVTGDDRQSAIDTARRRLARHPVRFVPRAGAADKTRQAARIASTENLSETGLFIATERPLPPGSRIQIDLRLPGLAQRLVGVVVWTRPNHSGGLPTGMGVRLVEPSFSYRALIQTFG